MPVPVPTQGDKSQTETKGINSSLSELKTVIKALSESAPACLGWLAGWLADRCCVCVCLQSNGL